MVCAGAVTFIPSQDCRGSIRYILTGLQVMAMVHTHLKQSGHSMASSHSWDSRVGLNTFSKVSNGQLLSAHSQESAGSTWSLFAGFVAHACLWSPESWQQLTPVQRTPVGNVFLPRSAHRKISFYVGLALLLIHSLIL